MEPLLLEFSVLFCKLRREISPYPYKILSWNFQDYHILYIATTSKFFIKFWDEMSHVQASKILRHLVWNDLYMIDIPKDPVFAEIFVSSNIFCFPAEKWGPKMDQNCKLCKIQNFWWIFHFKHCVCLIGKLPLVKISARSNNICGIKRPNPSPYFPPPPKKKRSFHLCLINAKNYENFQLHNYKYYTDKTLYLNKVFHLAKPWGIRA